MKLSWSATTVPCYLFEVWICKESPLVDCNFKAFIIDHSPVTPVPKLVNSHVRILQVDTQLPHRRYCDRHDIKITFMHQAPHFEFHKFTLSVWNMDRLSQQEIKKKNNYITNGLTFCTLRDFGFSQRCCWDASLLGCYAMLSCNSYWYFWRTIVLSSPGAPDNTV
jgi:hypothetical protein